MNFYGQIRNPGKDSSLLMIFPSEENVEGTDVIISEEVYSELIDIYSKNEGEKIKVGIKQNKNQISDINELLIDIDSKSNQTYLFKYYIKCSDDLMIQELTGKMNNLKEDEEIPVSYKIYKMLENYNFPLKDIKINQPDITYIDNLSYLTDSNFVLTVNDLGEYKNHILEDARQLIESRFDNIMLLDNFDFLLLNNILGNYGFLINDENREDQYIEIINKDDEENGSIYVGYLGKYLESDERLPKYKTWSNVYTNFLNDLREKVTKEDIDDSFNRYNEQFN